MKMSNINVCNYDSSNLATLNSSIQHQTYLGYLLDMLDISNIKSIHVGFSLPNCRHVASLRLLS
jgi:hypothetical protein